VSNLILILAAGTLAAFLLMLLGAACYEAGRRAGHQEWRKSAYIECGSVVAYLRLEQIDAYLNRRGLIAVPMGTDLTSRSGKEQACR